MRLYDARTPTRSQVASNARLAGSPNRTGTSANPRSRRYAELRTTAIPDPIHLISLWLVWLGTACETSTGRRGRAGCVGRSGWAGIGTSIALF
ncbi:hypothetical protein BD311DRAFT_126876 [Dichomitus squalens]|uniref:Uncharacterized protein n=1 Tax=Dichomitus squalens TaxID=114155 RepID=A0A4V2JYW6_9APHY|nr:hypothetical protein BD311DRAFT_126876 [Dichomitus squalens]